ncbi:MAG TPA: CopD family protein [Thermaerobacter sp.]
MTELIAGLLRFVSLAGLVLVTGPVVFDGWIVTDPGWRRELQGLSRRLVLAGGVVLLAAALCEGLWTAWQVTGPEPAGMARYFLLTRGGRGVLLRAAVGLLAALAAARCWPRDGQPPRLWLVVPLAGALAFAWNSHAGIQGPGAVGGDFVHIAASALWIGGLWRFGLIPWDRVPVATAAALVRRFSVLGALVVLSLAGTGVLAAYRNIYGAEALTRSPYGQALAVKLAIIAVLLCIAAVNRFILHPLLQRAQAGAAAAGLPVPGAPPRVVGTLRRWVRAEAVVGAGVLLAAAIMAVLPPADRPAAVEEPRAWRVEFAGEPVELAVQPGQRGAVTLVVRPLGRARPARGTVNLDMTGHPMGAYAVPLSSRDDGRLEGRAVLPMAGTWRLAWRLEDAAGVVHEYVTTFDAAGAPGNQRKGRLSLRAAFQSTPTAVQAVLGLAGMLEGAVLVVTGWRRLRPVAFGGGLVAFGVGVWLLGLVAWIDAYPTTFQPNPLPPAPEVLERGREIYALHCASCHGPAGRGDGPAAAGMVPPPADLTGVHVRQHTDGDLYWWITHGIEGTAMPAFGDRLTEEERWAVIHFVRRLANESGD